MGQVNVIGDFQNYPLSKPIQVCWIEKLWFQDEKVTIQGKLQLEKLKIENGQDFDHLYVYLTLIIDTMLVTYGLTMTLSQFLYFLNEAILSLKVFEDHRNDFDTFTDLEIKHSIALLARNKI